MIAVIIFIAFCFFTNLLCAQVIWTKEDSVKLSKILDSEMPIYIDSDLKKELEKSFIGEPIKKSYGFGNGFILDIKTYDFDKTKCQHIDMGPIFDKSTSVKFFNLNNEYLKYKKFTIGSHVDVANPSIFLRRNTILTFPLDRKLYVNISGSYTLDHSNNSILPVDPTPYTIGVGLSFNIRKNITIGPQANYQFNLIRRRWECFWGIKCAISF